MYNNPNYDSYGSPAGGTGAPNPQEYTYIHGIGFSPLLTVMRERRAIRRCANAIGVAFIVYIALSYTFPNVLTLLLSLTLPPFYHYYLPDNVYELISFATTIVAMGLPFLVYGFWIRIPPKKALPLRMPDFSIVIPAVFICLGASAVASFGSGLIQNLLSYFGIYAAGNLGDLPTSSQSATILYLLNSTLVPALIEEFVFRGVIMQSLRRFGDSFAVIVSAVLFAAAHGNVIVFPLAFTFGLCMGYFVVRTGSLWTSILVHLLYNSMSIGFNELFGILSPESASILDSGVVIIELLLALISLIYLACTHPNMFTLKPAQTVLNDKARLKTFFTSGTIIAVLCIFGFMAIANLQIY